MTKAEAVRIFGDSNADMARALGVTRSAIQQWPDELTQEQSDRVVGAAVRLGLLLNYTAGQAAPTPLIRVPPRSGGGGT